MLSSRAAPATDIPPPPPPLDLAESAFLFFVVEEFDVLPEDRLVVEGELPLPEVLRLLATALEDAAAPMTRAIAPAD